ncbi:uncharacterized protein BO87DRAFT_414488 [Aspergillus neoniger CBS 115656]|uniref:Uncharacterized protein n=1 Tax=Aspergillus neoniger (strain CBS 115656) TaxID=1448310 RepID=A0A318YPI7_ASPNB|nr:hypothetical protein BO87DRAFT_414488 [Aspergillus neoniger CBS 115656]PYH36561.1 hypothetical protein BO87DRAFT_414488 [Aspergillus neoniger CBS 115656]
MSSQQSSQPRTIQTPSLARDSHGNDAERDRRSISEESDLSHYLHYEDNDGFFPPAWLGKAPPTQHGDEMNGKLLRISTMSVESVLPFWVLRSHGYKSPQGRQEQRLARQQMLSQGAITGALVGTRIT